MISVRGRWGCEALSKHGDGAACNAAGVMVALARTYPESESRPVELCAIHRYHLNVGLPVTTTTTDTLIGAGFDKPLRYEDL